MRKVHACVSMLAVIVSMTVVAYAQQRTYSMSTIGKHDDEVLGCFVNTGNTMAATCSLDESIKLWSLPDGKEIKTLRGHTGQVNNISFSGDDKDIASASSRPRSSSYR